MTEVATETSEEQLWDKVLYHIHKRISECKDVLLGRKRDPKKDIIRKKKQQEEVYHHPYSLRMHISAQLIREGSYTDGFNHQLFTLQDTLTNLLGMGGRDQIFSWY